LKKYLIDTNIVIFYLKGKFNLEQKFDKLSEDDCFISEITLAELKFGVEKSERFEKNKIALDNFLTGVQILPIFS
jgi:tRNA(fMet)-specific endonuclease VapC